MTQASNIVYKNYDEFDSMPRQGLFTACAVDVRLARLSKYNDEDLIHAVDEVYDPHNKRWTKIWCLDEKTQDTLALLSRDERAQMPCGHVGFTNNEQFLQCNTCNGRFTKEEVQNNG